ncbi:MAG: protein BatD, partial [Bacteroidales bacterium]|nr:protein BatD [Bacteroidales bacterium]
NPPQISDFQVLAGPTTSTVSSTNIVNGQRTHTYQQSYTYILLAKGEGKFTIPPASVVIEGDTYTSKSITVEVVKGNKEAQSADSGNGVNGRDRYPSIGENDLILSMSLSKDKVVKGEPVIATLKLLVKTNISGVEDIKFPSFNGFWSQEIEAPSELEFVRETYNGEIYSAALLRKYMLLPQQTGDLYIDPAEMICAVQVRSSAPSRSIFDDFFDNYQTLKKRIHTPRLKVSVAPLPAGAPESFTGGVGNYKLDVKVSRDSLNAHEAASLIVTISGTGNLNLIEAPKVNFPPDFEVYDVKRKENVSSTSSGSSGTKSFEYPFIPRSSGNFEIESIAFSYYNVNSNRYVTLKSEPVALSVSRGAESGATVVPTGVNKQSVKSLGQDIRYIETSSGHLNRGGKFIIASVGFWCGMAGVVVLFLLAAYILEKSIARRQDVVGRRNRRAKKVAKMRLKRAEEYLKQELYTAFYEELHKAILGYLSDKLMIQAGELNRDVIREKLMDKGTSEEVITSLEKVVDACEYARYAPSAGAVAMVNHYEEAVRVISEIES